MPSLSTRRRHIIFFMPAYTFPARFEYLDEIREAVAEIARGGGFTEKTIYSLQLAADEAASNIIEHAYANTPGRLVMNVSGCTSTRFQRFVSTPGAASLMIGSAL